MWLWLSCTVTVLVTHLFHLSASEGLSKCSPGWSFYNKRCYKVHDEYETLDNATFTCALYGGMIAYGFHHADFKFLKNLMEKHVNFRYWYGASVTLGDGSYKVDIQNHEGRYISSQETHGYLVDVPKRAFYDREFKGQGIAIYENYNDKKHRIMPVEGRIKLAYICKLPTGEAPSQPTEDSHYFNVTGSEWVWMSGKTDIKSKSDANRKCKEMSMSLASIRDKKQMTQIFEEVQRRQKEGTALRYQPIWIGLEEANGFFRWSNGEKFDPDVVTWQKPPLSGNGFRLLYDATLFQDWEEMTSPFICMVNSTGPGGDNFGCPLDWIRAGPSCYFRHFVTNSRHTAARLCSKADSQLLSFKNRQEMEWFRISKVLKGYEKQFWTSLNDIEHSGQYVWQDGTALTQEVMNWDQILKGVGNGYYVEMQWNSYNAKIRKAAEKEKKLPGCQYPHNMSEGWCPRGWSGVGNYCYFITMDEVKATYATMLHTCYQSLPAGSQNITIEPVVIQNQRVFDLYFHYIVGDVWVAKVEVKDKIAVWPDGTPLDKTFFDVTHQPDVGTPEAPKQCVLVNDLGFYETANCDSVSSSVICKKEVPLKTGNSADTLDDKILLHFVSICFFLFLFHSGL